MIISLIQLCFVGSFLFFSPKRPGSKCFIIRNCFQVENIFIAKCGAVCICSVLYMCLDYQNDRLSSEQLHGHVVLYFQFLFLFSFCFFLPDKLRIN